MPSNLTRNIRFLASVIAATLLTGCGTSTPPSPTALVTVPASLSATIATAAVAARNTFVLADISDTPVGLTAKYQPLVDYLAAHLGKFGISSGVVKIAPDFDTMSRWIKTGEVDLYFDSPYPVFLLVEQVGAQPILRRWKQGASEFYTVFFTRKDSGITSIADLKGHTVSFKDPSSTSGYLLPKAYLLQAGFTPVEKPSPDSVVAQNEIGYVFSGSTTDNDIQWAISGKVAAGAVDNVAFSQLPDETR